MLLIELTFIWNKATVVEYSVIIELRPERKNTKKEQKFRYKKYRFKNGYTKIHVPVSFRLQQNLYLILLWKSKESSQAKSVRLYLKERDMNVDDVKINQSRNSITSC